MKTAGNFALMIIPNLEAAFRFHFLRQWWCGHRKRSQFLRVCGVLPSSPSQQLNEFMEQERSPSFSTPLGGISSCGCSSTDKQKNAAMARDGGVAAESKQLLEEEKLGWLGAFVSAIAHEIRNPVAMITSSLEMANERGATETERKGNVRHSSQGGKTLREVNRRFPRIRKTSSA